MGVVLLLVALPATFMLALVWFVFDGVAAFAIITMMIGVLVSLLYLARDWDAPVSPGGTGARRGAR